MDAIAIFGLLALAGATFGLIRLCERMMGESGGRRAS